MKCTEAKCNGSLKDIGVLKDLGIPLELPNVLICRSCGRIHSEKGVEVNSDGKRMFWTGDWFHFAEPGDYLP